MRLSARRALLLEAEEKKADQGGTGRSINLAWQSDGAAEPPARRVRGNPLRHHVRMHRRAGRARRAARPGRARGRVPALDAAGEGASCGPTPAAARGAGTAGGNRAPLAPVTARLDPGIRIGPHTATPAWRGEAARRRLGRQRTIRLRRALAARAWGRRGRRAARGAVGASHGMSPRRNRSVSTVRALSAPGSPARRAEPFRYALPSPRPVRQATRASRCGSPLAPR